jgi:hypothetical protein
VLVKILAETFVNERFDGAFDVAIQLALGLAFKLRLRKFYRDDGDETFANIVSADGDFVLLLFQHAEGIRVVVDRARERRTEAGEVRAAVDRIDRIGEGENVFGVGVVILQRDFHFHLIALAFHVNRRVVENAFAAVQMLHKFGDAAGEAEFGLLVGATLIFERDLQALVEEGEFAKTLGERVKTIDCGRED